MNCTVRNLSQFHLIVQDILKGVVSIENPLLILNWYFIKLAQWGVTDEDNNYKIRPLISI